jgi:hypothetical protein
MPSAGEPPSGHAQQDPGAILRRALSAAPAEGVPVSDLITMTAMSRRWVFHRLRQLAADGLRRPDRTRLLAHREMTIGNRECKVQVHALTRVCTYSGITGCVCLH